MGCVSWERELMVVSKRGPNFFIKAETKIMIYIVIIDERSERSEISNFTYPKKKSLVCVMDLRLMSTLIILST